MGFGLMLGLLLMALSYAIWQMLKPEPKPRAFTPTCPKPISNYSKEQEVLIKIRKIRELTIKGDYSRALVLLEELDVIIYTNIISNSIYNIIPVNSGELKE